jgi:DNA-binding response OmpR family regulator
MKQLIFVVEDEREVRELAMYCLEEAGYAVRTSSKANLIAEAENEHPSLILLAMIMPDGNGVDLCWRIRENRALASTPLIFLIQKAAEQLRALALESGGDDCIIKPFTPRELVARVQAILRRFAPGAGSSPRESADLVIDSLAMRLSVRGSEVPTTNLEFRLVEYMARHRGQVFTRDLLLDAVWGDTQFVTPRSVDACIRRVREKIELDRTTPKFLKTIRGVGYRFDAVVAWRLKPNDGCNCLACTAPLRSSRIDHPTERERRTLPKT